MLHNVSVCGVNAAPPCSDYNGCVESFSLVKKGVYTPFFVSTC